MTNPFDPEVIIEWREPGKPAQHMQMPIDVNLLYDKARGGSGTVRDFLRKVINQRMIEPLLDLVLREITEREESEAELRRLIGSPAITREAMEEAIMTDLGKRRKPE